MGLAGGAPCTALPSPPPPQGRGKSLAKYQHSEPDDWLDGCCRKPEYLASVRQAIPGEREPARGGEENRRTGPGVSDARAQASGWHQRALWCLMAERSRIR